MTSKLQKIARERNFAKMQLKGMIGTIKKLKHSSILTGNEVIKLSKIERIFTVMEKDWAKEWDFLKLMLK